jgi:hypothetical protein
MKILSLMKKAVQMHREKKTIERAFKYLNNELPEDMKRYTDEYLKRLCERLNIPYDAFIAAGTKRFQGLFLDWESVKKLIDDVPNTDLKIARVRMAISFIETERTLGSNTYVAETNAKKLIPRLEAMLSRLEEEKAIRASLADNPTTDNPVTSNAHLSNGKGMKINYIRVINCLYELGFFKDDKGNNITKKDVFAVFGRAVNKDLSDYDKDLSRSLSDSTALDKHLEIFDLMKAKMTEIFNAK